MCGIAGIVGEGADREHELLKGFARQIAHRGPDGQGIWTHPEVGLVHRRLSIIDLSQGGHQPMTSKCDRYALTFNGEIYNYLELRRELVSLGETFRTSSDTEVLLAALSRWGKDAVHRLNGMWSFGLWDAEERTLLACRDRFGKKPFYYTICNKKLFFASEIKALLQIPNLETKPNPSAVADFCSERISDHTTATLFTNIHQLAPGHWLTWKEGEASSTRYWNVPLRATADQSKEVLISEVEQAFERSVRLRLRADTDVGCLISGGLDSTAVSAYAAHAQGAGKKLHLFTTENTPPVEEAEGIDALVAQQPDLILHRDRVTVDNFWDALDGVLWHQEEPFADASMVAHYRLMRLARSCNVPVLLTGQGADEVFAGYPGYLQTHLSHLLRQGQVARFGRLWLSARRAYNLPLLSILSRSLPSPITRRLKSHRIGRSLMWLESEFTAVSSQALPPFRIRDFADLDVALRDSLTVRTLPGFLHYEDRNSMAHGVETRLPFLDPELVRLAFSIDVDSRLSGGQTKPILREAVQGRVPESVVSRGDKQGYPAPLGLWLRQGEARIRAEIHEFTEFPMVNFKRWMPTVDRFFAGEDDSLNATWRGYILLKWYDRFFVRNRRSGFTD